MAARQLLQPLRAMANGRRMDRSTDVAPTRMGARSTLDKRQQIRVHNIRVCDAYPMRQTRISLEFAVF